MEASESNPITRIIGYTFEDQEVVLDFHHYEDCTFRRCRIVYHAYGPVGLENNHIDDCQWVFNGPAASTIQFMKAMYSHGGGADQIIEKTINAIRQGGYQ